MSQRATMFSLVTEAMSDSPLPPVPIAAMLSFSFADLLCAQVARSVTQKPTPTAALRFRNWRRLDRLVMLSLLHVSGARDGVPASRRSLSNGSVWAAERRRRSGGVME